MPGFRFSGAGACDDYRVVCPDIAGRGLSDWLKDPAGYVIPNYVADVTTLIARLDVETVDWVGTSMGGLIGMALASMEGTPVRRLVLSDVGPEITAESIARIASYVGTDPRWPSFDEALGYIRAVSAPFGNLDDEQWRHLTEHSIVRDGDGSWRFRYDPRVSEPFKAAFSGDPIDLWPYFERIVCPTLVVRGAESDLLKRETWEKMGRCGHAQNWPKFPGSAMRRCSSPMTRSPSPGISCWRREAPRRCRPASRIRSTIRRTGPACRPS